MLEANIVKYMPGFIMKVHFLCPNGKLVCLTGPSGAGKTTLVRILAGLESADEGYILFNGKTWFDSSQKVNRPPQARGIGYVFQEHTLFPHLTVRDNIGFIEKSRQRIDQLMAVFKISHIADHKPHQISGGERQRAAFAQALARDPQVLLLDEPFSALDASTRDHLQGELKKYAKTADLPIVHVTHDMDEAEYLADQMVRVERSFPDADHRLEASNQNRSLFSAPLPV